MVLQDVLGLQRGKSGPAVADGEDENSGPVQPELVDCVLGGIVLSHLEGDLSVLGHRSRADVVDLYFVNQAVVLDPGTGSPQECGSALVVVPGGGRTGLPFAGPGNADRVRISKSSAETFVPHALHDIQFFPDLTRLDRAAHSFIRAMMSRQDDGRRSSIEEYASEQILLELAGSILLEHCGSSGTPGSASSLLRDEAMAVIAQRCADRDLKPEAVAKAVQSSLRRVQAAFAEVGNSIAAEIRRQRGRLARTLLTDARYDVLSVQQIAEETGFGTTAALRRALDELYGCGPRELRDGRGVL